MPYELFRRGGKYCTRNKRTKKEICYKSEEARKKGIRIREAYAHGWRPAEKRR